MKKFSIALLLLLILQPAFNQTPASRAVVIRSARFNQVTQQQIKNTSSFVRRGVYNWKIYIDAPQSVLDAISYVEYTLHPTFRPPVVRGNAGSQFSYSSSGWGEFNIKVKVVYRNNVVQSFEHWLDL